MAQADGAHVPPQEGQQLVMARLFGAEKIFRHPADGLRIEAVHAGIGEQARHAAEGLEVGGNITRLQTPRVRGQALGRYIAPR